MASYLYGKLAERPTWIASHQTEPNNFFFFLNNNVIVNNLESKETEFYQLNKYFLLSALCYNNKVLYTYLLHE